MDHLITLHKENDEVIMKRFVISRYASRLQYRLPEGGYRDTPFTYKDDHGHEKVPPTDAFDVIIDKLLHEIQNIEEMVKNPQDRGDWRGHERFPKYPFGRFETNLTHGVVPCLAFCKQHK